MKRIIFAAALLASQAAWAGQIHDEFNACIAEGKPYYRDCLRNSQNQGEKSLCLVNADSWSRTCYEQAKVAADANPENW